MHDFSSVISRLKLRIAFLEAEVSVLREENKSLRAKVSLLESENKFLRAENAKLKDKLGLTSNHSSIPTSKEVYRLKRNKIKSLRNRGTQPGHPGNTRSKLSADEIIDLPISDAWACGGPVVISPNPYIHQKNRFTRD